MRDNVELSLEFEDNETRHNDLVLRFAGKSWICDTYYLALDKGLLPEKEDAYKIRRVLQRLIEQWLTVSKDIQDGSTVYLPYDFSDQCTSWLSCCRSGDTIYMCHGWAAVEGWSLSPSEIGHYLTLLQDFRPDSPIVQVSMSEFVKAMQNLMVDSNV